VDKTAPNEGPPGWPRISVALIIVLVILTGGAYLLWWFHDRVRRINRMVPEHPVPASSLAILYLLAVSYVAWGMSGHLWLGDTAAFALSVKIISTVSYAWNGWVTVQMTSRLNRVYLPLDAETPAFSRARAGFLQFLYLQWKFNRAATLEQRTPSFSQTAPDAPQPEPGR